MKILIVTSTYPRWTNDSTIYFVHDFAAELVRQGHKVRVVAPHYVGAMLEEEMDGVEIRRFRYFYPLAEQTVCYQGGALGNLKNSVFNKLKVPFLVAFEFFALFKHALIWRPDLISSHWLIPQGLVGVLVSKLLRIKHVATVHGGDVFGLRGGFWACLKKIVIRYSDHITVNSSATEGMIFELAGETVETVTRIPTGIRKLPQFSQEEIYRFRRGLLRSADDQLCLFVGRLSEEKGVGDLIHAMHILKRRNVSALLLIVGDGHDREVFQQLVSDLGLDDSVRFEGWKLADDVYRYFSACDLFVGPSKQGKDGWIEAQGLTFAEAMLAGCGVVGSDSGGIPDLVKPGKTGWLFEAGNIEGLAEVMETALLSPKIHSFEARNVVLSNYLLEATTRQYLQLVS